MTIKRGGIASVSGNINSKSVPSYCPRCEQFGIQSELGSRLDYFAADRDQWLQCYHCGSLIPKHDIAQTGQLTTDIERIDSKFRTQKDSEHWEPPKHRRGFNARLDDKQDDIKDPEVKKEIRKGARLLSYTET